MSSAQAAQMLAMLKKQLDKAQASGNTQNANAILQQIALQEKKIANQAQPVMPGAEPGFHPEAASQQMVRKQSNFG